MSNLYFFKGDDWSINILRKTGTPPVIFDFTGSQVAGEVTYNQNKKLSLTEDNDRITFTDKTSGQFSLSLSSTDTSLFNDGFITITVWCIDASNKKKTFIKNLRVLVR